MLFRSDDADHPGVPAFADRHADRAQGGSLIFDLTHRLDLDRRLDGAALGVVFVQPMGERGGLLGIVGGQQAGAEVGFTDPAPGVDPGTKQEAPDRKSVAYGQRVDLRGRRNA